MVSQSAVCFLMDRPLSNVLIGNNQSCFEVMMDANTSVQNETDVSGIEYPSVIWIQHEDWEIAVKSTALAPIVILGVFGNITLLTMISRNSSLKTPTNLLIVNIAVTDLATLTISTWMFLVRDTFQNYVLGEVACKVEGFFEFSFLLTGVFNLVLVSYNRLMAIVHPHEVHLTSKLAKVAMAAAWIFGFAVAAPLIVFRNYRERQWLNFFEIYCEEDRTVLPVYWNVIISLMIWIPLGIMLMCYSAIFYKLDRYERQVLRREHPISVNYKKKVARTLFVVVVVFIICRVPFTAVVFVRSALRDKEQPCVFTSDFTALWFTCHYLMFTNAALNPIIYGLTNESFRRAFQTTPLSRWLFCNKEPSERTISGNARRKIWTLQPRGPCLESNEIKFKTKRYKSEVYQDTAPGIYKMRDQNQTTRHVLHM